MKTTNSKGTTYYLHKHTSELKGGGTRSIYYFSKTKGENYIEDMPEGYHLVEAKSGLPVLKKDKNDERE